MKILLLITVTMTFLGCSEEKKKTKASFSVPSVSEIVENAAPSGLKSGLGLTATTTQSDITTVAGMETLIKSKVFQKDNSAGTLYYRYFVDILDNAMNETATRIGATELEEGETRCYTTSPIDVVQQFGLNGQTINWPAKYNCWEIQQVPTAARGGRQIMAFSKDDNHVTIQ